MATSGKNLSNLHKVSKKAGKGFRIGIACSEWNDEITGALLRGALDVLHKAGVSEKNIRTVFVPGAFELPLASQWLLQDKKTDGVIAIGSVIQGETRHFDFVCQGVTQGIMETSLRYNKPVMFCVLTDNNLKQARDRSGGKYGNKGAECAAALVKMLNLQSHLSK